MEPITIVHGGVSVLDRDDVDTDQIIPKQFLKRVERTGFGEFLFYDWAKEPGWDLPPNPILAAGANFGCGSSREHAPEIKHRLLGGLDDIGVTLSQEGAIAAYERERERPGPVTTAL